MFDRILILHFFNLIKFFSENPTDVSLHFCKNENCSDRTKNEKWKPKPLRNSTLFCNIAFRKFPLRKPNDMIFL